MAIQVLSNSVKLILNMFAEAKLETLTVEFVTQIKRTPIHHIFEKAIHHELHDRQRYAHQASMRWLLWDGS